ncbi:MAG: TIGR03617 family F420-dependent LLM class oxidoreductase [Chloroflexi bacterium]|jgi:probable F420-dependent oxidoreductase|nr:TIGR03617 family F420-dependent LLM class oxidoreductase [Chloroflexota bacterium]MBT5627903.1 TIGR03617 family F420-dependent LLM class oxidoreductase [Chloroflexota bacterium]
MKVVGRYGEDVLEAVPGEIARLERLGYDVLTTGELKYEATTRWTLAAHASTRAEIGMSVMIAFPRSPFVTAQMAWELQRMTGGRISIGLGSQVKGHNERRFSTGEWVSPAARMEEYVQMMRAVWQTFQTGKLNPFEGDHYQFTLCPPAFNAGPIDVPFPKIFLAAVNPAMTRVAGRVADGLLPHSFTTEKFVREVTLPNLAKGAEQAGRDVADIEIAAGGMMALADSDSELEQKLLKLRQRVAFYGSTRTYQKVFEVHGQEELGQKLHEMSVTDRWGEMPDAVALDVVKEFAISGTYDSLPGEIERRQGFADRVSIDTADDPANEDRLIDLIQRVLQI